MASCFRPLESAPFVRAAFIGRIPGVDTTTDRSVALQRLAAPHAELMRAAGFDPKRLATAEQIHGDTVARADHPGVHAGADGLITSVPGLVLGIYTADCAAIYLADRRGRAVGLVHSGRTGTELNIAGRAVAALHDTFGVPPGDLIAHLSPCIRPPLYEVDFAAAIVRQLQEAGISEVRDDGICTGREVASYYSYRVEKGRTGRMLSLLSLAS